MEPDSYMIGERRSIHPIVKMNRMSLLCSYININMRVSGAAKISISNVYCNLSIINGANYE